MQIQIRNNTFHLLHQKAIFWEEENTLLISDLHIGKISHFRKEGIAVPLKGLHENFTRLDAMMQLKNVQRILFIGDLFHSTLNNEWREFCQWRQKYAWVDMHIVLGNHDIFPEQLYCDVALQVHKTEISIGPFIFAHHPKEKFGPTDYVISGHVHPVIRLNGTANQSFRFPCFYFGEQQALLPSFGYFTGGYPIRPEENDRVVAIVNETLIEI